LATSAQPFCFKILMILRLSSLCINTHRQDECQASNGSAGKYMPAILQNEINSELGGKVVAQVEENVFGGHGRNILIPAGGKAIGRYKPLTKVG